MTATISMPEISETFSIKKKLLDSWLGQYSFYGYLDNTLGVYHYHDAHGTHEMPNVNMTNQWQRAW
jgi:hypothetical protein